MEYADASMPIGFALALAQDVEAMRVFSAMPIEKQDDILASARNVKSRADMQNLVHTMILPDGPHRVDVRNQIT